MERTLVILKPDAVRRNLIGELISRFERRGLNITNLRMLTITGEKAKEHYYHVREESFFDDMMRYITSGPVVVMIIEGENVIKIVRSMLGSLKTYNSAPSTIRGDYGCHEFENLIHASDSVESAEIEIKRFFD